MNNIITHITSIICRKETDIDEAKAWQVLVLKHAILVSNFARPKLRQYFSVAINFCATVEILMSAVVWAINKFWGNEDKN